MRIPRDIQEKTQDNKDDEKMRIGEYMYPTPIFNEFDVVLIV